MGRVCGGGVLLVGGLLRAYRLAIVSLYMRLGVSASAFRH